MLVTFTVKMGHVHHPGGNSDHNLSTEITDQKQAVVQCLLPL